MTCLQNKILLFHFTHTTVYEFLFPGTERVILFLECKYKHGVAECQSHYFVPSKRLVQVSSFSGILYYSLLLSMVFSESINLNQYLFNLSNVAHITMSKSNTSNFILIFISTQK